MKLLPLALATLLLAGCGHAPDSPAATDASAADAPTATDAPAGNNSGALDGSMEVALKRSHERRAERVAHGDTLVLPYQELEGYLPASVAGYAAGAPEGETTKSFLAMSSAKRKYTQGDGEVLVSIVDFNGAYAMIENKSAVLGMNLESDSEERTAHPYPARIADVKGQEVFRKKTGEAEINLAVGDRFLVSITGTHQQGLALLEQVAQQLDLAKLARL